MAYELDQEPDGELATRTGALAMLIYSLGMCIRCYTGIPTLNVILIVAVFAGALLPYLSRRDKRLLAIPGEDEATEFQRLRSMVREWRTEAAIKGKKMKLPAMPVLLRTVWMGALLLFSAITFATFFVRTVNAVSARIRYMNEWESTSVPGYCTRELSWDLLGCCLLGAVCHHHGGEC
jgi:solute carrier family 45, member 1/2/4